MKLEMKRPDAEATASGAKVPAFKTYNAKNNQGLEKFQALLSAFNGILSSLGVAVDLRAIAFAVRLIRNKGGRT